MRARLGNLVRIDDEILAQAGQRNRRRSQLQIAQAALEERLVGQHRERRRAAGKVAASQRRRIKIRANQPLRWRGLLDFGDNGGVGCGFPAQRRRPSTRLMQLGQQLQLRDGNKHLRRCHRGARRGQNSVKVCGHTLRQVYEEQIQHIFRTSLHYACIGLRTGRRSPSVQDFCTACP